jgi:serine/threonine protein kinase
LLDLGLARRLDRAAVYEGRPIAGTAAYMAPEALTSTLPVDARSDLYSLGATLYELLTGRPPFVGHHTGQLAQQQRRSVAPDPRAFAPGLPGAVAQLVRSLLAKEPLRRPQSAAELIDRLARLEIATFSELCGD